MSCHVYCMLLYVLSWFASSFEMHGYTLSMGYFVFRVLLGFSLNCTSSTDWKMLLFRPKFLNSSVSHIGSSNMVVLWGFILRTVVIFFQNKWKKEPGTAQEKLPLQVSIASDGGDDDDDVDMPTAMAPSPTPWQRQSHLGKLAKSDDTHSFKSLDSDGHRPPSYNYVMKKGERPSKVPANGDAIPLRVGSSGSADDTDRSYKETTCWYQILNSVLQFWSLYRINCISLFYVAIRVFNATIQDGFHRLGP